MSLEIGENWKKVRRWTTFVSVATLGPWLVLASLVSCSRPPQAAPARPETPTARSFDGPSDRLARTVVVPTLDTPIPKGKSAAWCASFPIAWKAVESRLTQGPVRLANAQDVADRLNRAESSEADLAPGSFYANAGWVDDGIIETIRNAMAQAFPEVPPPEIAASPHAAVAYAYLQSSTRFTVPFFENPEPLVFRDATGATTEVASFGVRRHDFGAYEQLRKQVEVLFCDAPRSIDGRIESFAVDLDRASTPDQVVLARLDRKATLAETLAELRSRTDTDSQIDSHRPLGPNDTLLVPRLHWRIDHRFKELEGSDKLLQNAPSSGLYLDRAEQVIQFRLDRSGAELSSEATIEYKASPRALHFDRPFLIVLTRRGASQPFFVMWIENTELLILQHPITKSIPND